MEDIISQTLVMKYRYQKWQSLPSIYPFNLLITTEKFGFFSEKKFYISDGYHGSVIVEQYGMNGTVCMEDWDDSDANATCHMIGYKGGVVFGPQEVYSRSMPVWYTQFNCTGSEGSLADCPSSPHVSLNCVRSIKNAGVLCYNTTGIKMITEISHRHNDFIHCFVLFCLNLVDNVLTL